MTSVVVKVVTGSRAARALLVPPTIGTGLVSVKESKLRSGRSGFNL